jgi:DNA-binding transcriptional ArsR family regulator
MVCMRAWHHPDASELRLADVLHALSDPTRLEIVRVLGDRGEQAAGSFSLNPTRATCSHHFRVLREAGITRTRQEGKHLYVSLRRPDLDGRFPGLLASVLSAIGPPGPEAVTTAPARRAP